eukprot:CAMPEP_0115168456 /NCGR_PEP_ID=MMETSP0270-20121206/758_1 /TAXON_ID=71861 /ORGANISM="Scrippsiella trochoidea, Strain CCMP3099" /LENGTH=54 /DNA_ID=CAMNT_0002581115 /DNA_START=253 /DNA_END=417 /DNA_ORIENTATION=+
MQQQAATMTGRPSTANQGLCAEVPTPSPNEIERLRCGSAAVVAQLQGVWGPLPN